MGPLECASVHVCTCMAGEDPTAPYSEHSKRHTRPSHMCARTCMHAQLGMIQEGMFHHVVYSGHYSTSACMRACTCGMHAVQTLHAWTSYMSICIYLSNYSKCIIYSCHG